MTGEGIGQALLTASPGGRGDHRRRRAGSRRRGRAIAIDRPSAITCSPTTRCRHCSARCSATKLGRPWSHPSAGLERLVPPQLRPVDVRRRTPRHRLHPLALAPPPLPPTRPLPTPLTECFRPAAARTSVCGAPGVAANTRTASGRGRQQAGLVQRDELVDDARQVQQVDLGDTLDLPADADDIDDRGACLSSFLRGAGDPDERRSRPPSAPRVQPDRCGSWHRSEASEN